VGKALNLLLVLNALVLTLTDLKMGRSLVLFCAIVVNVLYISTVTSKSNPRVLVSGFFLVVYLVVRQLGVSQNDAIDLDSWAPIIFVAYSFIFILVADTFTERDVLYLIRFFLYGNVLFGIPDYFGLDISVLHVEVNTIERFRGLTTEPNLLAIPLMMMFFGLYTSSLSYRWKVVDMILMILVIFYTYSKAAYMGMLLLFIYSLFFQRHSGIKLIMFITILPIFFLIVNFLGWFDLLYMIPFYNNFLSLISITEIVNYGMNDYIISLSFLDQFQGGSLGTRLATGVATVNIFLSSPVIFLFGVGGGMSYKFVLEYIYNNGLENYEINYHLITNPKFITDKTYILNFLSDYGFIGFFMLMVFLTQAVVCFPGMKRCTWIQKKTIYSISVMFFTQTQFILVFLFLAFAFQRNKKYE
jgi:hypothetical protein